MSFDLHELDRQYDSGSSRQTLEQYTAFTFLWMFLGLMITFGTCLLLYMTGFHFVILSVPGLHLGLLIAELIVVIAMSRQVSKLSVNSARGLFIAYSLLNGLTFSSVLFVYGLANVIYVFGLTALYFGALAAYGYFAKVDLSRLRNILLFGLIFLIIAGVLLMFFPIAQLDKIVCMIGIVIFLAYTAYDTQKIRSFYEHYAQDQQALQAASIYSALQLYLDFINLFLYLLRFLGSKKN